MTQPPPAKKSRRSNDFGQVIDKKNQELIDQLAAVHPKQDGCVLGLQAACQEFAQSGVTGLAQWIAPYATGLRHGAPEVQQAYKNMIDQLPRSARFPLEIIGESEEMLIWLEHLNVELAEEAAKTAQKTAEAAAAAAVQAITAANAARAALANPKSSTETLFAANVSPELASAALTPQVFRGANPSSETSYLPYQHHHEFDPFAEFTPLPGTTAFNPQPYMVEPSTAAQHLNAGFVVPPGTSQANVTPPAMQQTGSTSFDATRTTQNTTMHYRTAKFQANVAALRDPRDRNLINKLKAENPKLSRNGTISGLFSACRDFPARRDAHHSRRFADFPCLASVIAPYAAGLRNGVIEVKDAYEEMKSELASSEIALFPRNVLKEGKMVSLYATLRHALNCIKESDIVLKYLEELNSSFYTKPTSGT
jgi:hypothetical protein